MGRDHHPKERRRQHLARKQGVRASYERILIVCEGSKTEPGYIAEIRTECRLHTANVVVRPSELGTAPVQVVQYARELFEQGDRHRRIQARAFERVFAVFDRDEHQSYFEALKLAESLDGKLRSDSRQPVKFHAVASVPSFELWLLLHFEDIRAPVHRDEVMRRLKNHIPGYAKGGGNIYAQTKANLELAIMRADALAKQFDAYSEPEPFTDMATLVKLLKGLRKC